MSESAVSHVADSLVAAWTSGDQRRLEAAVQKGMSRLTRMAPDSPFEDELRDLMLGILQSLGRSLGGSESITHHDRQCLTVCYDLVRNVRTICRNHV